MTDPVETGNEFPPSIRLGLAAAGAAVALAAPLLALAVDDAPRPACSLAERPSCWECGHPGTSWCRDCTRREQTAWED